MRTENVPTPQSPERPPLAPYDPPDPAPQASAWHRAMRVVAGLPATARASIVIMARLGARQRY
jgi:hypothetical protein